MSNSVLVYWLGLAIYMGFCLGLSLLLWDLIKGLFSGKISKSLYIYQGIEVSLEKYLLLAGLVFVTSFIYSSRLLGLYSALVISIGLLLMVQMFLYIRASGLRRKASYEGEKLLAEFLREYRIYDLNIFMAMEKLLDGQADLKFNKRHLKILLYEIRATGNPQVIKQRTEEFAKSIGTNWARMLAYNIYTGASKGTDISPALEDILIQLRDAKTSAEERKRLNSETVRMVYVMIPALYLASLFMAASFLDLPFLAFLKNQFATAEGLMLFYFIVFLFMVNVALLNLIMSQKLDY